MARRRIITGITQLLWKPALSPSTHCTSVHQFCAGAMAAVAEAPAKKAKTEYKHTREVILLRMRPERLVEEQHLNWIRP